MSPLQRLQQGIYNRDWAEVEAGFEGMTGTELYHKSAKSASPKVKKPCPKMRVKPKTKPAEPSVEEEPVAIPSKKTKKLNKNVDGLENYKTFTKRLPYDAKRVKKIGNKFKDNGTIARADKKIDKLLAQEPLVERSRKNPIVSVECYVCNKTYKVNKCLVHGGRFRCDGCCMGGSR